MIKAQLLDNTEAWNCVSGKGMNHQMFGFIKHSRSYCKMVCKVLMDGYEVLRSWMLEHTRLDTDHCVTIQSLASGFMLKDSCYDNVLQISGVLQQYITRAAAGGRCVTAKSKLYHVKTKISYVDACSLYPSAMYYMDGFLDGVPKLLKSLSYDLKKEQKDGHCFFFLETRCSNHINM